MTRVESWERSDAQATRELVGSDHGNVAAIVAREDDLALQIRDEHGGRDHG